MNDKEQEEEPIKEKASIKPVPPEDIRFAKKAYRKIMAVYVRNIYRSWGMSDHRFCQYLSEEFDMSARGIHQFLCSRKRMHLDLMDSSRLVELLDRIFKRYIANGHLSAADREKIQKMWNQEREQRIEEIEEVSLVFAMVTVVEIMSEAKLLLSPRWEELQDRIDNLQKICDGMLLLMKFLNDEWPDDPARGLSYEESQELKEAIYLYSISKKDLKRTRKKDI